MRIDSTILLGRHSIHSFCRAIPVSFKSPTSSVYLFGNGKAPTARRSSFPWELSGKASVGISMAGIMKRGSVRRWSRTSRKSYFCASGKSCANWTKATRKSGSRLTTVMALAMTPPAVSMIERSISLSSTRMPLILTCRSPAILPLNYSCPLVSYRPISTDRYMVLICP